MVIKEGDFIEVEYTAKTKEEGLIFDTTSEKTAKENNIAQEGQRFGAVIICVGEGHVLEGLDDNLVGKEAGKDYVALIPPEKAFGKKSAKMIQLVAASKFTKEGITPQPGLQVNIDDMFGIVKTVTGGRVLVDMNHPLSGQDIEYSFKVLRMVEDAGEKAQGLIILQLGTDNASTEYKDGNLTIKTIADFPQDLKEKFGEQIQKLIPEIKKVDFTKMAAKKDQVVDAVQAAKPTTPAEPTKPVEPTDSVEKAESVEPAKPAEPEDPEELIEKSAESIEQPKIE
ncbi:peptidylprolyl isomerase [Candidatus Woesearchaeota archaeon]|jgi:FKBP-type peptidyl-prolyl cis-trans isomerase SlyD|nr:peptidylprolyl isomerase [Candidatus Woesearchaeota archaeon]MBT5272135.1 peptidylprolyl isomerase [Candidatus Woesearchaeota archaeon]MBT6040938.1 peptidylprolyl isomerase [Candidatus Woesearchaeota archaeon]MBT6336272.1 peptidylprolyl isomerase [Candidatus Woesearchaeota archaeon]MBT7927255.1 peptidylprolyl isomerase [Candidatus Woesearchaeota archaeon]